MPIHRAVSGLSSPAVPIASRKTVSHNSVRGRFCEHERSCRSGFECPACEVRRSRPPDATPPPSPGPRPASARCEAAPAPRLADRRAPAAARPASPTAPGRRARPACDISGRARRRTSLIGRGRGGDPRGQQDALAQLPAALARLLPWMPGGGRGWSAGSWRRRGLGPRHVGLHGSVGEIPAQTPRASLTPYSPTCLKRSSRSDSREVADNRPRPSARARPHQVGRLPRDRSRVDRSRRQARTPSSHRSTDATQRGRAHARHSASELPHHHQYLHPRRPGRGVRGPERRQQHHTPASPGPRHPRVGGKRSGGMTRESFSSKIPG
ncbi:hypothetical protein H4W80_002410 [Nonomuraea angiospora]|uniref:Uncharacterized protein n=1 Tax=Nonomuraea angiospora TaxID=46172 RepID=A0ABR9LU19_9ACTN|nr:hypothetical protein [Nonomuraea angiospora]